jgi:hypothetical protein
VIIVEITLCVAGNHDFIRFVEAAYGYWSNSLSLIADSGIGEGGSNELDASPTLMQVTCSSIAVPLS